MNAIYSQIAVSVAHIPDTAQSVHSSTSTTWVNVCGGRQKCTLLESEWHCASNVTRGDSGSGPLLRPDAVWRMLREKSVRETKEAPITFS